MMTRLFSSRREVLLDMLKIGPKFGQFLLKPVVESEKIEEFQNENPLTDSFGRRHSYLRISLTERCNLRCSYCMPRDGVTLSPAENILTDAEIVKLVKIFADLGVTKLRFTGGEPTVRSGLADLIKQCNEISGIHSIHITSNGVKLPSIMYRLIESGLKSANISLDSFHSDRFETISRRPGKTLDHIFKSILMGIRVGNPEFNTFSLRDRVLAADDTEMPIHRSHFKLKLNCVVMRNKNFDELKDFASIARMYPISVRFIELMPFEGNEWNEKQLVSQSEMIQSLHDNAVELEPIASDLVDKNDTTKWFKIRNANCLGRIGFISSMSNHFCGGCNRLRITADGKLKICLFGDESLDLRHYLRNGSSDYDLINLIGNAVYKKKFSLGGHESPQGILSSTDRPMIKIGG